MSVGTASALSRSKSGNSILSISCADIMGEEVQWTDDAIRWEGGLHVKKDHNDGESDDGENYLVDPFK